MYKISAAIVIFCSIVLGHMGIGQENISIVKIQLIADRLSIKPGESFLIGIQFHIPQGHHIYWRNPGDAGLPPVIDWRLPDGFSIGDLQWPVPGKLEEPGGLIVNVYEEELLLFARAESPAEINSDHVTIGAEVEWMVCKEICTLEKSDLEINIPVDTQVKLSPEFELAFNKAIDALPADAGDIPYLSSSALWFTKQSGDSNAKAGKIIIESNDPGISFILDSEIQWFREPLDIVFSESVSLDLVKSSSEKMIVNILAKNVIGMDEEPVYNWGILKFKMKSKRSGLVNHALLIKFN